MERVIRGQDWPRLNNEIKSKMKERNFLLKIARRTDKEFDWISYRRARNSTTRKINYNKKIFNENLSRPKQFWNRIKKCYHNKNKTSSAPKSFCIEGKLIHNKHLISDSFCSYFTGIGKSLQAKIVNLSDSVLKFHNHTKMKRKVNPKNCSLTLNMLQLKTLPTQ